MSETPEPILIKRYASRRLYNTHASEYVTLDEIAGLIRDGGNIQIVDSKTGEDLTRQFLLQIISEQEATGENVLPLGVLTDLVRFYKDQSQSLMPDFLQRSFEMFKDQQDAFIKRNTDMMKQMGDAAKGMMGTAQPQPKQPDLLNMGPEMLKAWQERMNMWLGKGLTGNMAEGFGKGAAQGMMENMSKAAKGMNPLSAANLEEWQKQQTKLFESTIGSWMQMGRGEGASQGDKSVGGSSAKDAEIAAMKAQIDALQKKLKNM